ncbi:MAG: TldD/PmbA family protein [Candidatus Eisenbacteria bacterium]|nr:TldD/PmbA family protein [Candidatus Eisenbacteria bacterium]
MFEGLRERFREVTPKAEFCSLRALEERNEIVSVRQNVLEPIQTYQDRGVMITVVEGGGYGYAATADLSTPGLRRAVEQARAWARRTKGRMVIDFSKIAWPHPTGDYASPVAQSWDEVPLSEKIALCKRECERLKVDERIADHAVSLWFTRSDSLFLTNEGGEVRQSIARLYPAMRVTASQGTESQTRTYKAGAICRQGGYEILERSGFLTAAPQLAEEVLALLAAPNCPSDTMDLLLAPDQLFLQIHESVGHPLELDRILGDERNYAGTSFVRPENIGTLRYGSDLMNITFDPSVNEAFASYGHDDDGAPAERQFIIEKGILKRALGSVISQSRTGIPGVANSRADGWRRPPIDRMANLNLEPGDATLEEMIGAVDRGIYMRSNNSWSIDDSRNKFQFGCEWGQLIEKGKLTTLVKNPNYRGISANFWNNLKRVGDATTVDVMGAPNCGKGEPNQIMRVGHVTPAALFAGVEVFGGD